MNALASFSVSVPGMLALRDVEKRLLDTQRQGGRRLLSHPTVSSVYVPSRPAGVATGTFLLSPHYVECSSSVRATSRGSAMPSKSRTTSITSSRETLNSYS